VKKNGGLSVSAAMGRARPEVTSTFDSLTTVFLLVFNSHYLSNMYCFKVLLIFLIIDYDGMSISTTSGRLKLEMTSPVHGGTMVSYSCASNIFQLSCTVSTV
jgi:hypothetical protein